MRQKVEKEGRQFRLGMGLPTQQGAKSFFAARDIVPEVDLGYVRRLSGRVSEIVRKLNGEIHESARWPDMDEFCRRFVLQPTETIISSALLPSMNNQGRRPEEVFFSWLRGYSLLEFFTPSLAKVFAAPLSGITHIGDDDLSNPETFRRTARADLEIESSGRRLRLEAQTGFQGVNDIKEHKVREARSAWETTGLPTVCAHFDVYNGRAAFVSLHEISADSEGWVTRPQMEGQKVFPIKPDDFRWEMSQPPPPWEFRPLPR